MPLTPNKLANRQNAITFEFAGEQVHLSYSPNALNDETKMKTLNALQRRIQAAANTPGGAEALDADSERIEQEFAAWFCEVITSWDYVEDSPDGQPGVMVPLTPERIIAEVRRFGDFITRCAVEAVTDYQAVKSAGTTSPAR